VQLVVEVEMVNGLVKVGLGGRLVYHSKRGSMGRAFTGKFEKIDDYRWKIPADYMPGMRVPGIIFSDEEMLKTIIKDNALIQVANAAHLPGIVKASMAMPDIHWGYGLPIGGVVATDIEAGGVIAPGGIGYDINCLAGDSKILMDNGAFIRIKDFEHIFKQKKLACLNFEKKCLTETPIIRFLKIRPSNRVLQVETLSGNKIIATEDHPFWTIDGMIPLRKLHLQDEIAVYPFKGVPYENPTDEVIINEQDITNFLLSIKKDSRGNGLGQIIKQLNDRGLLPLRYNSPQLPYILKIMGYNFGDGNIFFNKKRGKGCVSFYGDKEDLLKIRQDIDKIGFKCSKSYLRSRDHKIKGKKFKAETYFCKVTGSSFAALLVVLGTPLGKKTRTSFGIPEWIRKAPLWQKRLFLASFFGAEMSSPKTMTGHGYNYYCPTISLNKHKEFSKSGYVFLSDIKSVLKEFDVTVYPISKRMECINERGDISVRFRLMIKNNTDNLINLHSRIGFEYNRKRIKLSNSSIQYLKMKKQLIERKIDLAKKARELSSVGVGAKTIYGKLKTTAVNMRFIERSIYGGRKGEPRMSPDAITFNEFFEQITRGMDDSGMVWDKIKSIDEIECEKYVYDFTVSHEDHNFIADNFIVSNCGVRLMRTNLFEKDVAPRARRLIDGLFAKVPTGVGSTGKIKVDFRQERNILIKGAEWAVGKGYGWEEDLEYCEERGAIRGADPSKVSDRARQRGQKQSGTLGSGNHFLEVQVVDEIYSEAEAKIFGIEKGQITVMIHTGSRGFGHQVCGDYAAGMIKLMTKFGINVPDRQLACVPVKSEEGAAYLGAMRSAANYAWGNRQVIMHLTRQAFEEVFGESAESLGLHLVYDVAHNIGKIENYEIDGRLRALCVHRKGATRAFGPGHKDLPAKYRQTGQPVIIPGDMGRCSYLLRGTKEAEETFYSTCHGAGRLMSRTLAKKITRGRSIVRELADKGIIVRYTGRDTLGEEASDAYKDVTNVVDIVQNAGLSKKVAKMRPIGVIKG